MKTKQTNLFDLTKQKGKLKYSGTCIHYEWKELKNLVEDNNMWKDLDRWSRWYYRRTKLYWASQNFTIWIKTYEMLSTNKSKTKKTNME